MRLFDMMKKSGFYSSHESCQFLHTLIVPFQTGTINVSYLSWEEKGGFVVCGFLSIQNNDGWIC